MDPSGPTFWYYVHDHLYSPVALLALSGTPYERYEYDAYGKCYIMDASYNPRSVSSYGNPFYFTGREMDFLDNGNLKIMNYRHRYYDTYTGRFTTHDPLGYVNNLNLYEYVKSNPMRYSDPFGNSTCEGCDHLYMKRCWVVGRWFKYNIRGEKESSHQKLYEVGSAMLDMISTGEELFIGQVAGQMAEYIKTSLPSLDQITWLAFKPVRKEKFLLAHFKCGSNCSWDVKHGKLKHKYTAIEPPGWWESSEKAFPISWLDDVIKELLKEYRHEIIKSFLPGYLCRPAKFTCKKGEVVKRPDGARSEQKCEEFEWKTEYE